MFITALFIVANIQKQLKCPSTDEWIQKKIISIYTYICIPYVYICVLLIHNKERHFLFATTRTWRLLYLVK